MIDQIIKELSNCGIAYRGEVSRLVLTPEMVGGWGAPVADNDNGTVRRAS